MTATYCFKCRTCGSQWESPRFEDDTRWVEHPDVIRDYRAESAAPLIANLARERTRGGDAYWRDQFLPTAAELAGPGDPDGSKGIRKWNDEHVPREGNSKPLRPEGPKQVY